MRPVGNERSSKEAGSSGLRACSGKYNFPDLPAGDYFVVAIPEEQAVVWREPGRLAVLSRLATRVRLTEGQAATQDLRTVTVR